MAARSAMRSEKKLELEKEGVLAKMLTLKPFACSEEYIGKPNLPHARRMRKLGR